MGGPADEWEEALTPLPWSPPSDPAFAADAPPMALTTRGASSGPARAASPSGPADVFRAARILVVDDEPLNLRLLELMLGSVGVAAVHGVTDPRQVVRRCHEVDLVLLDLHMPHHDGFAVLAELRATLPDDAFLPVLVLTADASPRTRDRALAAGATDFLIKPFDRTEVLLRVGNLLRTRALHVDVQERNAELHAELDRRSAHDRRLERDRRERSARIEAVLAGRHPRIVFQPIVDLTTGVVRGVEALARFDAPPRRPPNAWFEEAREVGRGDELEVVAVVRALEHLDRLPPRGFLAINVSAETAVAPALSRALERVAPDRIMLELTEHGRVDDYEGLLDGLAPLRDRGVGVAVDDAGAGYAGLSHVLRLGPDVLKLDLDLIRGIDRDPAKRALSAALVMFARETGALIVAEGIETRHELATLQRLGVEFGQGHYLAPPAPLAPSHGNQRLRAGVASG